MSNGSGFLTKKRKREKGYTLAEVLMSGAIAAMFMGVLIAALLASRQVCTRISAQQGLQQQVNVIMNKIVKGGTEPGGVTIRLDEASQCTINSLTSLTFQMSDAAGATQRTYSLNNAGNSILYNHPTAAGIQNEVLYNAPTGATLTLRFWPPAGVASGATAVGIDVALIQTILGSSVSASATTMINLRNRGVSS